MRIYLLIILLSLSAACFGQTKTKSAADAITYKVNIDYGLMDRILSQHDIDDTHSRSILNASFRDMCQRLKMVSGNHKNYVITFFNHVLQAASRSILSDDSIEENFMRIFQNEKDAITYALKYPTVDMEQEFNSGKIEINATYFKMSAAHIY